MQRSVRALLVLLAAAGLGLVTVGPVAAECDGPFPSFREVAPGARTPVIGDVVAVTGGGLSAPAQVDVVSAMEATTIDAVFALTKVDPPSTDTSVAEEPADADEPGGPADPAAFDPWPWVELLLIAAGVAFLLLSRRERT
jgi:hypothetical protein